MVSDKHSEVREHIMQTLEPTHLWWYPCPGWAGQTALRAGPEAGGHHLWRLEEGQEEAEEEGDKEHLGQRGSQIRKEEQWDPEREGQMSVSNTALIPPREGEKQQPIDVLTSLSSRGE